jgi:hypothetical protein
MAAYATVNERLPRPARLIDQADVICPAGCVARAGGGVLCRIEGDVIDARLNPLSVGDFCLGDYQSCPTWRAHKNAISAGSERAFREALGTR